MIINFSTTDKFNDVCCSFALICVLTAIKNLFAKIMGINVVNAKYFILLLKITPEKAKKTSVVAINIATNFARFLSLKCVDSFDNKEKQKIGYRIDLAIFCSSLFGL